MNALNPNATIAQLYYLLIHADGRVDDKEIAMGKKLVEVEGLNSELFYNEIDRLEEVDYKKLLPECSSVLRKFEKKIQIRYIAWLCVIANSDGFMDKEEWKLIYQLYHNQLKLSLDAIMIEQKEIKKQLMLKYKGVA
ncbi:MAG: TerB family tellurite resistance protein [Cyclobacteriaceae bacterium]|nr:TerB family tellurite resistance protein [Cyclobacteriaceae bacterium]